LKDAVAKTQGQLLKLKAFFVFVERVCVFLLWAYLFGHLLKDYCFFK